MFTKTGLGVMTSAGTLLAVGVLADYPELVILGLAGVAMLMLAALWMLARPQVTVVREFRPCRTTEKQSAVAVLTVTSTSRRWRSALEAIETVADQRILVQLPSLAPGGTVEKVYLLPTDHRGRYRVPALTINQCDPLRLLRIGRAGGRETVLYVHPRVHRIAPVSFGGPQDLDGPTSNSSPQDGVAFHSLRDYLPGDDFRRIHWKSTARTGTLMVQHTVIPDQPRHLIVLDSSAESHDDASFEDAVRVAASLCVAASRAGFPVELRTTGDAAVTVDQSAAFQHSDATFALDILAGVRRSASDRGVLALADLVRDVVSGNDGVVLGIVSGPATPRQWEILTLLRPRFLAVTIIHIGETPTGYDAAPPGVVTITARTSAEFADRWNRLVPQ